MRIPLEFLFRPLLQYPDGRAGGRETNASLFAGIASSILHPLRSQYRDQQHQQARLSKPTNFLFIATAKV